MRVLPLLGALGASLLLLACENNQPASTAPAASIPHGPDTRAGRVATAPAIPPVPAAAAPDSVPTFTWHDDACTNVGTYTASTYTRRQLAGSYWVTTGFGLLTTPSAHNLAHYTDAEFRRAATRLEHEHDSLASLLRGLEVVPTPFWRTLKHLRELQLAEQYEQDRLMLAGYFQPASLRTSRYYTHYPHYADALASSDSATILAAFRQLLDQEKVKNAFPEQFDQEYVQATSSPDGIRFAKMKLLTYGWGNCMASRSKYNQLDDQYQPLAKFEKLFRHIEQRDCVDVD